MHVPTPQLIELDYPTHLQVAAPDLSVTMAASPNPVLTGSNVTYTITVRNDRPGSASNVVVTDNLPATVAFVSCSSSAGGTCGGTGNNRTVNFASLAGGTQATVTFVGNVNCSIVNGTTITNTATVSSTPADADLTNNSATATFTASNPPPAISNLSVDKPILWPPDHTMRNVAVSYKVTDNCGPVSCALSVTSNEPINGLGDGDLAPDWQIIDPNHVNLRAERSGLGTGRIYTVTATCTDSSKASSSANVSVNVPFSQAP